MPRCRRFLGLLAPAVLVCLPACGGGPWLPLRDPVPEFPPPPDHGPKRQDFAVQRMPVVPGESVALRPPAIVAAEPDRTIDTATSIPAPPIAVKEKPAEEVLAPKIDAPLVAAVGAFQAGNPDAAIEQLKAFDKPNQELLLQLIPPLVRVSQLNLNQPDPEETGTLARQFESAAAVLTKRTGLTVKKAVLCLKVNGYGQFTPVRDRNDLRRRELYFVYLEVGNVPCEPHTRGDGQSGYQTRLDVSMQVKDELGQVIEIIDAKTGQTGAKSTDEKTQFSLSAVRDYHVTAQLQTPARPGGYTVTMEVRDPKTGTVVSRQVPFRVQ